ncbi:MAG: helix-turn-helix transcriptional regulator [Deltaproteobacteria bacterium]|nr:helix-turn-helix transcriptional regulator [Deltaproteobacteria bacterium]
MKFGLYLKNRRKQKSITQEDLARALNVSSVFIHQLETGKVDAPSLERCQQMADILGLKIEELWNVARNERLNKFMEREGIFEDSIVVLTEGEKMLVRLYRTLDSEMRRDFSGMIYMLLRRSENDNVQEILEEFMKCA